MNTSYITRQLLYFLVSIVLFVIAFSLLSFKDEQDSLHKRNFTLSLSEIKDGVAAKKIIMDKIEFKNGKLRTDFLQKKFGYKWIRYHINKDSIFTDATDTEVRWLQVEASSTDDKNQTVLINFTTSEWDLDGTLKITKNDRLKKYYNITGREKGGKPKKQKQENKSGTVSEFLE